MMEKVNIAFSLTQILPVDNYYTRFAISPNHLSEMCSIYFSLKPDHTVRFKKQFIDPLFKNFHLKLYLINNSIKYMSYSGQ
jgi:hypothetical protein